MRQATHRRNSGRKSISTSADLRRALQQVVQPEHIEAIGRVLLYKSLRGDMTAIKELFDRLWGRPQPVLDASTGDKPRSIMISFSRVSDEEVARAQEARRLEKQQTPRPPSL